MENGYNNKSYSFSFEIEEDEKMKDFIERTCQEINAFEVASKERIIQLFQKVVEIDNNGLDLNEYDNAIKQLLILFSLGYKHGWNDYKDVLELKEEKQ